VPGAGMEVPLPSLAGVVADLVVTVARLDPREDPGVTCQFRLHVVSEVLGHASIAIQGYARARARR
jgi:hypothetical protein